jgi:hypothetical protein
MVRKRTMNMLNVLSVSVIHVLLSALAVHSIGTLFTDLIHGTGMYILMVCTLMLSRHLVIRFGGIGVTTPTVGDGTMAGDGIVLTMVGDITRVHGAAGMVATGVASMAAVIGDIITTGVVVLAGAGAVEAVIETCYTPIVALLTGVLTVQLVVLDILLTDISLLVLHLFVHLRIEQLQDV